MSCSQADIIGHKTMLVLKVKFCMIAKIL